MYELLHSLLSDHKGGTVFTCFGIWHILYMAVIFCTIILLAVIFKRKSANERNRLIRLTAGIAFGLYMADFFLMPFAYGAIDLEKLPFHMCTLMCVLCFLSSRDLFLGKLKLQFALLGLASNLIYVIYPAGVGWYQIHPLSYRVVQTLLFHGTMTAYGIFCLALGDVQLHWRECWRELPVIAAVDLWAILGNTLYNGTYGDYDHFFNWFFVVRDPFYILPANIAPYIMPFVMLAVLFAADLLIYAAWFALRKLFGVCKRK